MKNTGKKAKSERMTFRKFKKTCMLYPEDKLKRGWEIIILICLMITCIKAPLDIAFIDQHNPILRYTVDVLFSIDIFIIFNSAYYNAQYDLISDRKQIASNYLKSWFLIDLLAVVPLDLIMT
jgi:hypothetical protein